MQHLTLRLADLQTLLARARMEARTPEVIRRLEWIVQFVEQGQSLENTARLVGVSPATLRRWIKRFDPSDLSSLEERSHMPQKFRTSTVPADVIGFIRAYREREPLMGKERIADLLLSEHNVTLSASTIGRVIEREKLYFADTPLHLRKRVAPNPVSEVAPVMPQVSVPTTQPYALEHRRNECMCLPCRLWNRDWRLVRKSFLLGSILANVAIVGLIVATMFLESEGAALPERGTASVLHTSAPIEQTTLPTIDSSSYRP